MFNTSEECIQYIRGYYEYIGEYLEYIKGCLNSTAGGYHVSCGGYCEYINGGSVHWKDIIGTSGDVQHIKGYHEYIGHRRGLHSFTGPRMQATLVHRTTDPG